MDSHDIEQVFNFRPVSQRISTSGQPTSGQLELIRNAGFEVVIDLAPVDLDRYSFAGEPERVAALGMQYFHIPVDFRNPTDIDFFLFSEAMDASLNKRVWIHCAANYRVTVFYSLWAEQQGLWDAGRSDEFIRSVWESDPQWKMNDVWQDFIANIRAESHAEG